MNGYVQSIREKVGNRPLILAGSAILIFNKQGKVLIQKRTDNKMWGLPGGFTECGESLEETAIREAFEETGLIINEINFFNVFSGEDFFYEYPNGDQVYFVTAVYFTQKYSGFLNTENDESIELQFINLEEVLDIQYFDENDKRVVRSYLKKMVMKTI